jgi:hypothetical protein
MNRPLRFPFLAMALALVIFSADAAEKPRSSFWKKLLRVTGISANPGQMKSPEEDILAGGQLWIADVVTGERKKIIDQSGLRSPIFTPDGAALLLLRSNKLCLLQLQDNSLRELFEIPGVFKLIGFDRETTNEFCALVRQNRDFAVQAVSLSDGAIATIPHDPDSADDRRLITHLQGWLREYPPDVRVYPARQTKTGISGRPVGWNDILFKRSDVPAMNVSQANGYNCSHPSLSPDRKKIAYIKSVRPQ